MLCCLREATRRSLLKLVEVEDGAGRSRVDGHRREGRMRARAVGGRSSFELMGGWGIWHVITEDRVQDVTSTVGACFNCN